MKKSKNGPTEEQIQDSIRLRELFADRAGMSQLEFGHKYDIGNQGMVWQYLNADKPNGSVLNIPAAIKFAKGLHCRISDFSPSIQEEIDRIAGVATQATPANSGKPNIKTAESHLTKARDRISQSLTTHEATVISLYAQAPEETRTAIDVLLLSPKDRAALAEASREGENACAGIRLLERDACAALSALHKRKKAQG